ncbi:MAG: FkbM family methyltransferase [Candidatus Eisenbacteria bacterium]
MRPIPFVVAATAHGPMIVSINDRKVTPDGRTGIGVGWQIFNMGAFDPDEVELAKNILRSRYKNHGENVFALDLGANIGVHTIEWARLMQGWGQVFAVEAQQRLFYALCGNIAINNLFNAQAIHAAVGATAEGIMEIPLPNYYDQGSLGSLELRKSDRNEDIGQPIDYSKTFPVSTITVDSMAIPRLDFAKIDVEGMEMEVLVGAEATITSFKPILLVEHIKSDVIAMKDWLVGHGYSVYPAGINLIAVHNDDPCIDDVVQQNGGG